MNPLSWSRRTKAYAAVLLALLLWAPQGISTEQQPIVTGHSTFYNGDTYDKCLASVAGLLRSRVMWFNDMVLAERYGGKGTFVYITEQGAPDPTRGDMILYSEGVFFDFVDPNGAHWHVEEAYMDLGGWTPGASSPGQAVDYVYEQEFLNRNKTYVWFVELSERPISDQFAPPYGDENYHDLYNFLVLVDTCKFHNNTATYADRAVHDGSEWGHPVGEDGHGHDAWNANIWVGTRPMVVPVGADPRHVGWQSEWSTSPQAQENAGRAPAQAWNQTAP